MKPIGIDVIFLITFFISVLLSAKEKVVHGVIATFDSIPPVGVEIPVKSIGKILKTDSSGDSRWVQTISIN